MGKTHGATTARRSGRRQRRRRREGKTAERLPLNSRWSQTPGKSRNAPQLRRSCPFPRIPAGNPAAMPRWHAMRTRVEDKGGLKTMRWGEPSGFRGDGHVFRWYRSFVAKPPAIHGKPLRGWCCGASPPPAGATCGVIHGKPLRGWCCGRSPPPTGATCGVIHGKPLRGWCCGTIDRPVNPWRLADGPTPAKRLRAVPGFSGPRDRRSPFDSLRTAQPFLEIPINTSNASVLWPVISLRRG